mgnify:FL=1
MKILALEKEIEGKTTSDFQPYLESEAKMVWELQQKGIIREIYFRDDQKSAVLILEASNTESAKKILDKLPLVKNNLIFFEVIPLRAYPGFQRLFK